MILLKGTGKLVRFSNPFLPENSFAEREGKEESCLAGGYCKKKEPARHFKLAQAVPVYRD